MPTPKLSCAFYTGPDTPDHIALAERLGYHRAWVYDSPALCLDAWSTLARAADRTERIGLATGVAVPALRHLFVTASAIATIESIAPGRFTFGVGTGFTGLRALGHKPMKWADIPPYVQALKALLRGESVRWEGKTMQLMHATGYLPELPIDFEVYMAAEGPKGLAVAREHADGVLTVNADPGEGWEKSARWALGTVLDDGESPTSDRVWAAAGHAAVVLYHLYYEAGYDLNTLPNGAAWAEMISSLSAEERHVLLHKGHLMEVSEHDDRLIPRETVEPMTFTGTVEVLRARIEEMGAKGISEVVYQPAGPDIRRELEAFAQLAPATTAVN
ncbi:5,10-methylenetetrahydromethanopterin reductase [Amycolatopsis marina]|uniref:5,10-methylenetetrahydromethanopterin reductase n=1 Tax=Amycolatopsis marina TaxID=490629 RepID=A0A1I0YID0_9PSEU|nr:LLM class flavin-dependent oxidoreductase [Amycolatopsis marina]SFB13119.1 5,10-methylenetetrahydromethanopterin reductase [Amycolatopsis marina]